MSQSSLSWTHVIIFLAGVCFLMWLSQNVKQQKLVAAVTCIGMICVAGLRHGYVDTRLYRLGFIGMDVKSILSLDYILDSEGKDKGFYILNAIIKLIYDDSQFFLFLLSAVTVGLLFWGIYNNIEDKFLGIFLFVTVGCYLDTMNGVRQYLASAILFFFLPKLIEKRQFFRYLILVLLASTIHGSALLFIPVYFIATKKSWSVYTVFLIGIMGLLFVFFNTGVGNALAELLEDTSYGEDYGQMLLDGNTSTNLLRPFIAAVPLALSLYNFQLNKETQGERTARNDINFNMALVSFFCWLFSARVLYFYRLAIYFQPYVILLICDEIKAMRSKSEKSYVRYITIILYLIYFLYTLYIMGNHFFVGYLKY